MYSWCAEVEEEAMYCWRTHVEEDMYCYVIKWSRRRICTAGYLSWKRRRFPAGVLK
jgi:hypothetical protein